MFGAFSPCPIRLTSVDSIHGWSASQHARMCSDLVSAWRTLPLAILTVQVNASSVQLVAYNGRNGSGFSFAPTLTWTSATQPCKAVWENYYTDEFDINQPWSIKQSIASIEWSGAVKDCAIRNIPGSSNTVDIVVEATPTTPYYITIVVYGTFGPDRQIGDYGGDLNKSDNTTECFVPYAAQWYQEMQESRGSAYTKLPYTIVDCENIAIARVMSAVFSRTPEKYSANATPSGATERLNYWVKVLGVPNKPNEPDWLLRQRCVAHYKAAVSNSLPNIDNAIRDLLGQAYVGLETYYGADLESPPSPTFWPGGSGDGGTFSIGGYTWLSRRAHLRVNVTKPPGLTDSEFLNLMDVQLFQLMDRMIPAKCTWNWSVGSDGFIIDLDKIGIDAV